VIRLRDTCDVHMRTGGLAFFPELSARDPVFFLKQSITDLNFFSKSSAHDRIFF